MQLSMRGILISVGYSWTSPSCWLHTIDSTSAHVDPFYLEQRRHVEVNMPVCAERGSTGHLNFRQARIRQKSRGRAVALRNGPAPFLVRPERSLHSSVPSGSRGKAHSGNRKGASPG